MNQEETMLKHKERYKKTIKNLTVMSDIFARNVFKDKIAHIDRIIRENGKEFGDEEHFIYVDSSKDDGGELGRLMHDFRVKEAKEMQAGALKDRVHELKETEKGVEHMCKEMEALRLEGVEEGRLEEKRENAKSMAEDGMTVDRIAKILKVNAQMVQEWLAGSVSTAR